MTTGDQRCSPLSGGIREHRPRPKSLIQAVHRQRIKRFATEEAALRFEQSLAMPHAGNAPQDELAALRARLARLEARVGGQSSEAPAAPKRSGDGVYEYATRAGTRYRFAFRQADGRLSNRRDSLRSVKALTTTSASSIGVSERHGSRA